MAAEVVRLSLPGRCRFRGSMMIAVALLAGGTGAACGQSSQPGSVPIQNTEQSTSIHGVVINTGTHRPLARALVEVEGRSILTGYDGKFEFAGLSGTTTTVRVTKPGFYAGPDASQEDARPVTVGSPSEVELKLYPEALITGTISALNGDPLAQVSVEALRRMNDQSGSRWVVAGHTNTNIDGQFRLPLPGGEYVVETQYVPERFGTRGAVLPILFPAPGSSGGTADEAKGGASTMRVASGSEQHLELHSAMRPSHAVHIQMDSPVNPAEEQFAPPIQVHLSNGLVFSPPSRRDQAPGEVVLSLPNGSYMLSASTGQREDAASYGETRVTVADEDVTGVTIHLQKALELPVEASVDPAAVATSPTTTPTLTNSAASFDPALGATIDPGTPSFVQQLGIFFQKTDAGVSVRSANISPTSRRGGPAGFTLPPGRYRLRATGSSTWFVESATAGGTDLLTQELVIDGGSSSLPLRLVVNNQTATIKGTTKLDERATGCFLYLIASASSATPVMSSSSGSDGSFSRGQIPPGSYRVVATETKLYSDLTDPAVQRQLAPYMKTIAVAAGETGSVDLDAMPATELKP